MESGCKLVPCYHPLTAYRTKSNEITFSKAASWSGTKLTLPCGQCIGCRLERSRQWALRCTHEASQYEENIFITLTYDDEHLPPGNTLIKSHFQKFIKRLRKYVGDTKIRYYHCGEYGEATPDNDYIARPHYHALIFNLDFQDKTIISDNPNPLYTSPILDRIWGKGLTSIGSVTFESAAYVARYVMKKITGERAAEHYININKYTGEINDIEPEYNSMSRRPGIGSNWYDQYRSDVYPSDYLIHNGMKLKPPRFYDKILESENPELLIQIKENRITQGAKHKRDATPQRLLDREVVKLAQLSQLHRKL